MAPEQFEVFELLKCNHLTLLGLKGSLSQCAPDRSMFSARRKTSSIAIVILSVCLSVTLVIDPRLNGTVYRNVCALCNRVMFIVFEAKFRNLEFTDSPQTRELNRGTQCQKRSFDQYAAITRKRCEIADRTYLASVIH